MDVGGHVWCRRRAHELDEEAAGAEATGAAWTLGMLGADPPPPYEPPPPYDELETYSVRWLATRAAAFAASTERICRSRARRRLP